MSRFGDGLATGGDLFVLADSAAGAALDSFGGRVPDLVCVFVSGGTPDEVAAVGLQVSAATGAGTILGCSAGGVIGGSRGVEGRAAVSVFAALLPGVGLRSFHLEVLPAQEGSAVVGLPEPQGDEIAVLLSDPYSFPADGFLTQVNAGRPGLAVVGGQAGGARGAGSTRLILDGRIVDRGAVGVLLQNSGALSIVSQGCRAVGPAMTVTAAAGNVVSGLAGEPALRRIERVLADLAPEDQALASAGLQLGIAMDEYAEDHDFLVRPILGADRATGQVAVGDVVEVGCTVRLQVRDADTADAALRSALAAYRRDSADSPAGGALLFSCNGRGAHLFGESFGGADHDPSLVRTQLAAAAVGGFFAGGELGPVAGRNHLHGFTASVLAFPG